MKGIFTKRKAAIALSVAAGLSAVCAQSPPPVFELSVLRFGDVEVPPLFYAEVAKGQGGKETMVFHPLKVGDSPVREVQKIPLLPAVNLYTGDPDARDGIGMKPWLEVPAPSAGERLLLLVYFDAKGQPARRFLDDSARAHPAGSVRVVNCSDETAGFSVGGAGVSVAPGKEVLATPSPDAQGRFDFSFSSALSGGSPPKRLYFPGKSGRLLVVFGLVQKSVPTGKMLSDGSDEMKHSLEPLARRLFDQAPEK